MRDRQGGRDRPAAGDALVALERGNGTAARGDAAAGTAHDGTYEFAVVGERNSGTTWIAKARAHELRHSLTSAPRAPDAVTHHMRGAPRTRANGARARAQLLRENARAELLRPARDNFVRWKARARARTARA